MADLLTLGHSTRSAEAFLELLRRHGVRAVADVRLTPYSWRYPHFGREALASLLADHAIAYRHFPDLGGRRRPRPDSPNGGWRSASFRGYADYMATEPFARALDDLLAWAIQHGTTALMCAEAVPWRCHRALIADALLAGGIVAGEAIDLGPARPHRLTPFARIEDGVLTYPADHPAR
ncbi:MAG TPA: DUF488 domain-containing protein [Chloroflexota bacterium]|jgi:uncharacterized protein (DUF488 family)|nr:DUF488 domain-containing protein [Chloroflexota bacterium]